MLAYLGRYTHRVAIANSRLISMDDDRVAFRWRDYRHGGKTKVMTLDAHEFIRRFLLHTLPDGFHRIRHYGFLANGHRATRLDLCRRLLANPQQDDARTGCRKRRRRAALRQRIAAHVAEDAMITLAIWRCGQAPPSPSGATPHDRAGARPHRHAPHPSPWAPERQLLAHRTRAGAARLAMRGTAI